MGDTSYQYDYQWQFAFERSFDLKNAIATVERHWYLSYLSVALYLGSISHGQRLMKDRPPLNIKLLLIMWNVSLALFSVLGCVRFLPDFFHVLRNFGIHDTVCQNSYLEGVPGRWSQLFMLSKFAELFDTAFLVLRKRPVIFLHWYHHATVLLYVYHCYTAALSPGRWFVAMNYVVHSIMYTYYAVRAAGLKIPRTLAAFITCLQVLQMFVALYIVNYAIVTIRKGIACESNYANLWWAVVMYSSYAVLFVQFFCNTYFKKPNAPKTLEMEETKNYTEITKFNKTY